MNPSLLLNNNNLFFNSFRILFSIAGVAVGSGWQSQVACVNVACYYLVGFPLGLTMEWVFHQGVMVRSHDGTEHS